MKTLTADTKITIKRSRPALTGDTKIRLSQIKDLPAWVEDAENLPPRKWSDGKMHEKVAGEWREVSEQKEQKQNGKNTNFNYTLKKHPSGSEYYEVNTNSDKAVYKKIHIHKLPSGEYYALSMKKNKWGVELGKSIPGIKGNTLESVKQQLEDIVNGKKDPKQVTSSTNQTQIKLTPETKIKISQSKPAESNQQKTNASASKSFTEVEERIQKMEAEEKAYQEALKEKPKLVDGYESYQGIKVIDKKLRKNWETLERKATEDELWAIEKWGEPLGGDPYIDFQAFTRDPTNYKDRTLSKNEVTKLVKDLDGAFKKAPPVGTNLIVVAGQGNHSMFFNSLGIKEKNTDKLANEIKKHIGETITNKSYLSTAVNEKGAAEWHKSPIEMRIKVPKDKRAIYLNASNIDSNRYTDDDGENELFINRGAKYRIDKADVGKDRSGHKSVLVELTLIDDGVKK